MFFFTEFSTWLHLIVDSMKGWFLFVDFVLIGFNEFYRVSEKHFLISFFSSPVLISFDYQLSHYE